ncbi:hypothetical protein [Natranaeroarchaeum aerophilus]|uniref:Uncharacterized protein n=1 Tax=Natranaeroarchaeum aerophilus TaxID=2917711 RepID=A0AAE3FME7_9EURY|nr:hypothetical protein [Natranaeroarchaeum aerophilus]MCL9812342.1 hypothetical protein [Natranaeroarchaeum aerophilus]
MAGHNGFVIGAPPVDRMSEYYVTLDGDQVAGPFETRAKAKRYADEQNTNEVGLTYTVERVRR